MRPLLQFLIDACCVIGRHVGWLILPLVVFVCGAVLAARFGVNQIVGWSQPVPLLGDALTVNSLLDLQWSIFALVVLFGGVYALRDDQHVSVDFLSGGFSPRTRLIIRTVGDLFLLVPFAAIIVWYGTKFAMSSFASGEGSTYGGLMDRWIVKACVPFAFALLGIFGLSRALLTILDLASPGTTDERASDR
jgi:TRAP-type mannitol/chloroaromatic compound transport system permease small subunit